MDSKQEWTEMADTIEDAVRDLAKKDLLPNREPREKLCYIAIRYCSHKALELVPLLLTKALDFTIDVSNNNQPISLLQAAVLYSGASTVVPLCRMLLDAKADVEGIGEITTLSLAINHHNDTEPGNPALVQLLLDRGARIEKLDTRFLYLAVGGKGRGSELDLLVKRGLSPHLCPASDACSLIAMARAHSDKEGPRGKYATEAYATFLMHTCKSLMLDDAAAAADRDPIRVMKLVTTCAVCDVECNTKCGRCGNVYYCSKKHQRKHWKQHRKQCCAN